METRRQKQLMLSISRIIVFSLFALFYLGTGFAASILPYSWGGDGGGSGLVLWLFSCIPFMVLMLIPLSVASCRIFKKCPTKAHKMVTISTALIFILNAAIGTLFFNLLEEIKCAPAYWIAYGLTPFLYGFLFHLMEVFFERTRKDRQ